MPSEVVGKLNDLVLKELRQSEVQEAFSTQAATPAGASPAAFAAQIQAEADRWLPIVQAAGLRPTNKGYSPPLPPPMICLAPHSHASHNNGEMTVTLRQLREFTSLATHG